METTALNCRNNCAGTDGFRGGRSSCRFELRPRSRLSNVNHTCTKQKQMITYTIKYYLTYKFQLQLNVKSCLLRYAYDS